MKSYKHQQFGTLSPASVEGRQAQTALEGFWLLESGIWRLERAGYLRPGKWNLANGKCAANFRHS
jgi:hypothetical protein